MLRIFVAIDWTGLLYELVGLFQRAGWSSPSTGLTRVIPLTGFGVYSGNLSSVAMRPFLPGCAGLNALSCSILLTALDTPGLGSLERYENVFAWLNTPFFSFAAYCEKGFSCSLE